MSRTVRILFVVIASCASPSARSAARFKTTPTWKFVPTPYPAYDAMYRAEAMRLDAAHRIASPERFQEVFEAAVERLDDRLNTAWNDPSTVWCWLYLGDWLALRAVRFGEREDWQSAIKYYEAVEQVLTFGPLPTIDACLYEEVRRILAAARAGRERIEAHPPTAR